MPLTSTERGVLDLEREWPVLPSPSTKRDEIRARLGISAPRYYEILTGLVDSKDAVEHDPLTVLRLRRRRAARRRAEFVTEAPRQRRPH